MSVTSSLCICLFIFCDTFLQVVGEYCTGYGHRCTAGLSCCGATCCTTENLHHGYANLRWSVWNMWYFWFIVIFILMSCFGGCGYWRRRQLMLHQQQAMLQHQQAYNNYMHQAAFSPPHTSVPMGAPPYAAAGPTPPAGGQPEGSFPAPPPYSEATKPYFYSPSKDDLPPYPGEYGSDYSSIMNTANTGVPEGVMSNDGTVPGLPPYTAMPEPTLTGFQQPPPAQPVLPSSGNPENQAGSISSDNPATPSSTQAPPTGPQAPPTGQTP